MLADFANDSPVTDKVKNTATEAFNEDPTLRPSAPDSTTGHFRRWKALQKRLNTGSWAFIVEHLRDNSNTFAYAASFCQAAEIFFTNATI